MNRLPVRFNSNFISKKIDFSAHRCPSAAQHAFLPVTRSRSICAGVLSVVMMWSGIGLATAEDMGPVSKKHIKLKKEAKHHKPLPTGPVFKDAPVAAAAAIPPCSQQSAAALQNTYALKGWIIPVPNFGDSVSQDYGCYRTNLAKYGIGFFGYGVGIP